MHQKNGAPTWLSGAVLCAAVLVLGGCTGIAPPAASSAASAPLGPGAARIWFYRDYEPSVSLNVANVALNGARAGSVQPDGGVFYRDVAPGHYHITVESYGADVNQDKDVDLAPGQEAFVKVLASDWISGFSGFRRDTFMSRWCRRRSRAPNWPTGRFTAAAEVSSIGRGPRSFRG
jgi:hypothetical protein